MKWTDETRGRKSTRVYPRRYKRWRGWAQEAHEEQGWWSCNGMVINKADYTEEEAKGGEEMTKGEYQRYQRLVIRYFPDYLIYQLYRRPKKCKLKKVIWAFKGAKT